MGKMEHKSTENSKKNIELIKWEIYCILGKVLKRNIHVFTVWTFLQLRLYSVVWSFDGWIESKFCFGCDTALRICKIISCTMLLSEIGYITYIWTWFCLLCDKICITNQCHLWRYAHFENMWMHFTTTIVLCVHVTFVRNCSLKEKFMPGHYENRAE